MWRVCKSFAGLNSKMHTFITEGIIKNVVDDEIECEDAKFFLFNRTYMRHEINRIQSKGDNIWSHRINKVSLPSHNNKKYTSRWL